LTTDCQIAVQNCQVGLTILNMAKNRIRSKSWPYLAIQ
jgi:hypothetical protein